METTIWQEQEQQQKQFYEVDINGKTFSFTFDNAYEKRDRRLINVIVLLCELSDIDTNYNILYYISNKIRFDKISNVPMEILMGFIDEYSEDYDNDVIESLKVRIQKNYGYIYVLQKLYSQKTEDEWDKYLYV